MKLKEGIYDNTLTRCRETYWNHTEKGAQLIHSLTADCIQMKPEAGGLSGRVSAWGSYPDHPFNIHTGATP